MNKEKSEAKKIKELEAEILALRKQLQVKLLEADNVALQERLKQINKAAGFPDNTIGL